MLTIKSYVRFFYFGISISHILHTPLIKISLYGSHIIIWIYYQRPSFLPFIWLFRIYLASTGWTRVNNNPCFRLMSSKFNPIMFTTCKATFLISPDQYSPISLRISSTFINDFCIIFQGQVLL